VRGERKVADSAAPTIAVPAEVKPLLERLGELAREQGVSAYAVGGCVRDWWLGLRQITDVDVAVVGDALGFARCAAAQLRSGITPHEQFGTATLELQPEPSPSGNRSRRAERSGLLRIDVATCRKETYAKPAAYPKVAAGQLADDLFRRDFTINAMAMEILPERLGRLIDPHGGRADLKRALLRILHEKSFRDDPSRILRAARFAERYQLSVEPSTARCLRGAVEAGLLGRLNRGRVRKELERLAEEPDPIACLTRLGRWLNLEIS